MFQYAYHCDHTVLLRTAIHWYSSRPELQMQPALLVYGFRFVSLSRTCTLLYVLLFRFLHGPNKRLCMIVAEVSSPSPPPRPHAGPQAQRHLGVSTLEGSAIPGP